MYTAQARKNIVFRKIPESSWQQVLPMLEEERFGTNVAICHAGSLGDSMYIIAKGSVLLQLSDGDRERPLLILQTGEFFGERSVISPGLRLLTAKAIEATTLVRLRSESLQRLQKSSPEAHWDVVQSLMRLNDVKARIGSKDIQIILQAGARNGLYAPNK